MTRPGWYVAAEREARDEAIRAGIDRDYLPDRDEAPTDAPAVEDGLMERIRAGARLEFEQKRREEHWALVTEGRL